MGLTEKEREALAYVADVVAHVKDFHRRLVVAADYIGVIETQNIDYFATVVDALVRLDMEAMRQDDK